MPAQDIFRCTLTTRLQSKFMRNVWRHHALHIIIVRQEKLAELTEKADELGKEYDEAYQNATDLADVLNSYDELKKIKIKIQEAQKKISRLEKKLKQKNSYWWRVVFGQILTKTSVVYLMKHWCHCWIFILNLYMLWHFNDIIIYWDTCLKLTRLLRHI